MFLISKEKYDLLCAKSMQGNQSLASHKSVNSITCDRPCNCEKSTSLTLDQGKTNAESVLNRDSSEQDEQNQKNKRKRELSENTDDDNGYIAPKKLKVGQENVKAPFPKSRINSNQNNRRNARRPGINKTKDNNINVGTKKIIGGKSSEVRSNPSIFNKGRNEQNDNNNKRKREVNENDDNDNAYIAPKKLKLDNNGLQNNNQSTKVSRKLPIFNKNTNERNNKNKRKRESNENDDDDDHTYPVSKKLMLGNNGTKNNNQCTQNKKKYRKVFVREIKLQAERNNSIPQKPTLPLKRRHEDDDNGMHAIPTKMRLYEKKPIISCIGNKTVQNKWIHM